MALVMSCAAAPAVDPLTPEEISALDRDDAAAEAAADRGDFSVALRYMDYFGHEQEDFALAVLEYGRDQRALRRAVTDKLGQRAWRQTAAALGVPRHDREGRKVRREGGVVFVRNEGARHDVPYVRVRGVWKVSVRDVLLNAIKASLGDDAKVEEADLHVLAGKMGDVLRDRGKRLESITDSVRSGKIRSTAELEAAVESVREGVS